MTTLSFARDIAPLLTAAGGCMKNVQLGDDQGTENIDLGNYDIVKRFYYRIQVAIHGHDFDQNTGQPLPGSHPLLVKSGPDAGQFVLAPHPMPPSRRLAQATIDLYDQWVDQGMPA
jgi:hypothetical protein